VLEGPFERPIRGKGPVEAYRLLGESDAGAR